MSIKNLSLLNNAAYAWKSIISSRGAKHGSSMLILIISSYEWNYFYFGAWSLSRTNFCVYLAWFTHFILYGDLDKNMQRTIHINYIKSEGEKGGLLRTNITFTTLKACIRRQIV